MAMMAMAMAMAKVVVVGVLVVVVVEYGGAQGKKERTRRKTGARGIKRTTDGAGELLQRWKNDNL
jgi:hypothetical protein